MSSKRIQLLINFYQQNILNKSNLFNNMNTMQMRDEFCIESLLFMGMEEEKYLSNLDEIIYAVIRPK